MNIRHYILLLPLFLLVSTVKSYSDKCEDYLVLSNGESIVQYGIDSTGHWWAVTEPFQGQYRITIDEQESEPFMDITNLTFSQDGQRWAYFGKTNTGWELVSNDSLIILPGTGAGEILFSPDSRMLIYSYFEGMDEVIIWGNKKIRVLNREGRLFSSWGGEKYAFVGKRGDMEVVNINGRESPLFDEIKPIGFWNDGSFVYAARSGDLWEIFFHGEALSQMYMNIFDVAINHFGTVAGILARRSPSEAVGIILSDDYYDPLVGKPYDWVGDLALHPEDELISYKAMINSNYYIVLNNTEYYGGETTGSPHFTYDGSELYFIGCSLDCFINIGGRQYNISSGLDESLHFAMKPGSKTIAYATSATMVVRYLETNQLYAGTMMDELIQPIYNWRTDRYETLGRIGNRLFLMTCRV